MKVTTELKNLIKRSFDEKRAKVSSELKSVAQDLFEEKRKEVASSKEFKAYVKASAALYERFKDDYKEQGDNYNGKTAYNFRKLSNLSDVEVEDIVGNNSDYYARYNEDIKTNVKKEITELDLAQESLMIKLTYEKDLDDVREMLGEYGIII